MSLFRLNEKVLVETRKKKKSEHPWQKIIKGNYNAQYNHVHNSVYNPLYPKEKQNNYGKRTQIVVIGNKTTKEFIYCYYMVKGLCKYRKKLYEEPIIRGVLGTDWPNIIKELFNHYGTKAYCLRDQVIVIINKELIGGAEELAKYIKPKYIYNLCLDYYQEQISQLVKHIHSSGRPTVYIEISIDGKHEGILLFVLYDDIVPRTCQNFIRLCETNRGGYAGTPVHRIVKDCWIQCGGFNLKEDPNLGCENFVVPTDRRGVLCMANDGRHVACSTQFFILLQPASWMKHKYVAFGQLVQGDKVLSKIENVPTWYESPTQNIIIERAGFLDLDCHRIPVNKKTREYLTGHVEDLIELREYFLQLILERVYEQIEIIEKIKEELAAEEGILKEDVELTEAKVPESITEEAGIFSLYRHFSIELSDQSLPPVPTIPYYIPLTDVPYPGEIDSNYDLKKFLKGNYCYDPVPPSTDPNKDQRRLSIPQNILAILFETYELCDNEYEDLSELSLDSNSEELWQRYVSENSDNVSFAGNRIKKIANLPEKLKVFDFKRHKNFLTDEQLRLKRVAVKEYDFSQKKSVFIDVSEPSVHTTVARRATGYVRAKELAQLGVSDELSSLESESSEALTAGRKVRDSIVIQGEFIVPVKKDRQSVLFRLLQEVAEENPQEDIPTLKTYKREPKESEYIILQHSQTLARNVSETNSEKIRPLFYRSGDIDTRLTLQLGNKIYRKLSTEYVKIIGNYENEAEVPHTFTAREFSKIRPAITVKEYKLSNKILGDKLKSSK